MTSPFILPITEKIDSTDSLGCNGIVPNGISIIYIDGLGNSIQEKPWVLQDIAERPEQQVMDSFFQVKVVVLC